MVIIRAISCAGSPTLAKGLNSFSSPSVSSVGFVQKVSSDVPIMSSTSLIPINAALYSPSYVILRNFHCHSIVPSIINTLSTIVNSNISSIALSPLIMYEKGTPDSFITVPTATAAITKPQKLFTTKSPTKYASTKWQLQLLRQLIYYLSHRRHAKSHAFKLRGSCKYLLRSATHHQLASVHN